MVWRKLTEDEIQAFEAALPADERAKMFGLPHGKVAGHMSAGRHGEGITVRLPESEREALLRLGARTFEPMPG